MGVICAKEIALIICTLFLSGKDASSYLMKDKTANSLMIERINRWHRDGLINYILYSVLLIFWGTNFSQVFFDPEMAIASVLIRPAFFDLSFSKWSSLPQREFGTTAFWDIQFTKIFGKAGAVKKSLFFLFILVLLNLLKIILKWN